MIVKAGEPLAAPDGTVRPPDEVPGGGRENEAAREQQGVPEGKTHPDCSERDHQHNPIGHSPAALRRRARVERFQHRGRLHARPHRGGSGLLRTDGCHGYSFPAERFFAKVTQRG
ncbi:hypothetical protein AB0I53_46925 [Saccharopolyspora sp. NPDC050389]|uniref:hypothetical protein n=1 Tax=Saccharopolyspora sp. NPDC050389 TaxID=3155516 RepID=UPI0033DCD250